MPLSRPTPATPAPTAPLTIDRADLTGMAPETAHEAIVGALHAGCARARAARGMIDNATVDAALDALTDTRRTIERHAPHHTIGSAPSSAPYCTEESADTAWPCPTYRAAADTIADGLATVVTA